MDQYLFATAGRTPALDRCVDILSKKGISFTPELSKQVTHLLLPIPSVDRQGHIPGNGSLEALLGCLRPSVTLVGGGLPQLPDHTYGRIDLLEDEEYLCQNAYITAHCCLRLAGEHLGVTFRSCPCLLLGWGRIGKCLAQLLRRLEADLTVVARKPGDRAILRALGYKTGAIEDIDPGAYRLLINTVPRLLLPDCPGTGLKLDLASSPGMTGPDVIQARGLPGKMAPVAAGEQMAGRILYYIKEGAL